MAGRFSLQLPPRPPIQRRRVAQTGNKNGRKSYVKVQEIAGNIFLYGSLCTALRLYTLFSREHTELVVDGEYKPFHVPRPTMEKLMELVESDDVDYIYEVFSPAMQENADGLYERTQEFVRFIEENVRLY